MRTFPKLASLTPDERTWRLDWFGDCAYPGLFRRYTQPSIKVAISPLRGRADDTEALLQPSSTGYVYQREVWAPVAALPLLAIGDMWQDGRLAVSPKFHGETFRGLSVDSGTTSFVKAGLAIDGKFLIPLHAHPWHRLHTQAYCVMVSLDGERRLLIPCVELIRFYFGSSSNLLQRLFCAPLTPEALWLSKSFDPGSRHMHLVLASGLSGQSASDVARIAGSHFAWRSAARVHASCQKATASGLAAYPYTGFPFAGSTDLSVSGVWLPFGDEPASTFLAYRIDSCSYAFPFRSLSYEMPQGNNRSAGNGKSDGDRAPAGRSSRISTQTKTVDEDPSARKIQQSRTFSARSRFPDLLRKPVWKERIEDFENTDVFLLRNDGSIEQVAFGEPAGSSDVPGIDATLQAGPDANPPKPPPLPHFVRKALAKIHSEVAESGTTDITVQAICPIVGRPLPVFALPVVLRENGEPVPEIVFSYEAGRTRQRRACFAEVIERGKISRLLAIVEAKDVQSAAAVMEIAEATIHGLMRSLLGLPDSPRDQRGV